MLNVSFDVIQIVISHSYYSFELLIYSKSIKTHLIHLYFQYFFQHGLVNQNFVLIRQLCVTFPIKRVCFVSVDCQYALFKSTCSKTSYLTLCNVPHEWLVISHRALKADWVVNIFPTSKFRYVLSISKYSKTKSFKIANNFRVGGSGKL